MSIVFSKILKTLRQDNHISQKELANELGVSQATVYQWENGNEPSMEKLEDIASYFCVNIGALFGEKNRISNCLNQEQAELVHNFNKLNRSNQLRLLGYSKGLLDAEIVS